jgi:hypothetical protein
VRRWGGRRRRGVALVSSGGGGAGGVDWYGGKLGLVEVLQRVEGAIQFSWAAGTARL